MADKVYRVRVVYETDSSAAEAGVKSFTSSLGAAAVGINQAMEIVGKLGSALVGLAQKFVEIGNEAQQTSFAIAALINANDFRYINNFNDSMVVSEEIMNRLRKRAETLPVTFQQLADGFKMLVTPGRMAGASLAEIMDLAAKTESVGKLTGIGPEVAAREMGMLLEGRATMRLPMFAHLHGLLSQTAGKDVGAKELNAMDSEERLKLIFKALERFKEPMAQYRHTWGAISTTFETHAQEVMRLVAARPFQILSDTVEELNDWYVANREEILEIAATVSSELADAFKAVVAIVKDMAPTLHEIKATVDAVIAAVHAATGFIDKYGGDWRSRNDKEVEKFVRDEAAGDHTGSTPFALAGAIMGEDGLGILKLREEKLAKHHEAMRQFNAYAQQGGVPRFDSFGGFLRDGVLPGIEGVIGKLIKLPSLDVEQAINAKNKPTTKHNANLNVNVKIDQTINDADNPARVLIATKKAIQEAFRHPTMSPGVLVLD